jgi:hypothetical protein
MTSVDDETLDGAYEVYEEFGPARRVGRRDRLHERYPRLSDGELNSVMEELETVAKTVWSIAELGGEAKIGKDKIVELLQMRHPYLKGPGLRRATFMVNYLALHEGYDR